MTPARTCIGCRAGLTPGCGVRVTRAADGSLRLGSHLPGRGAWLCRLTAVACAQAATKRRAWSRALRADVPPSAVDGLLRQLEGVPSGVGAGTLER